MEHEPAVSTAPVLLRRPAAPGATGAPSVALARPAQADAHFERDVDVCIIGDAFVDIVAPVAAMPQWGKDLESPSIGQMAGGSALNVAVGLGELMRGRARAQCSFFGLVGDDEFGAFLRRRLSAAGVRDHTETAAGQSTGCCIVLSGAMDRGFVTSVGATGLLSRAHLLRLEDEDAGRARRVHLHISGYFSCPSLQLGLAEHLRGFRKRAEDRGQLCTISFDTNCDASGQWNSGVQDVLREVDIFLPNEVEALGIAQRFGDFGQDTLQASGLLSLDALDAMAGVSGGGALHPDNKSALSMAADRLALAVRHAVVITCGEDGCILQTHAAKKAREAPRRFAAPKGIQPVDATGLYPRLHRAPYPRPLVAAPVSAPLLRACTRPALV